MLVLLEAQPGGGGVGYGRPAGRAFLMVIFMCAWGSDGRGWVSCRIEPSIDCMSKCWLTAQPQGDLQIGRSKVVVGE